MTNSGDERNGHLRSILKQGDPAAGDPRLSQEELRTMRRAVLNAVPEPRRRGWLVPLLASSAAGVILAAAMVLSLWRSGPILPEPGAETASQPREMTSQPRETPPQAREMASQPRETAPQARETASQARETASQAREMASQARETAPQARETAPQPWETTSQAQETAHQIQFSTPGGTRVIWLLNPAGE